MKQFTNNPRKITKKQFERLRETLEEYGDLSGVVHDLDTDEIIGGNQRAMALNLQEPIITERFNPPQEDGTAALGYFEVEGQRFTYRAITGWSDEKRRLANLVANHGGGTDDWDILANYDVEELFKAGFDDEMMASMKSAATALELLLSSEKQEPKDTPPRVDAAERLQKKWQTEPLQLWRIGDHRLYIGDSTEATAVENLMEGTSADLIYTDPPYGVSYEGALNEGARDWAKISNDDLRGTGLQEFLTAAFTHMHAATKENAAFYCWHASRNQREFENALNAAGFTVRQQLIWNKGMVLGHADYHWAHEPLFYGVKTGQSRHWFGDRSGKTIMGARRTDISKMRKEELQAIIEAMLDATTTWEIDRDTVVNYQHSTQKPIKLALRAITNNSLEGETVIDFFAGSGSTGIAAANLGRIARMIELDPGYAAVILERFKETFPDLKIERIK